MSRTGAIYMLVNDINGKKYIGQTVDLNERIRLHKVKDDIVVDKAIDKYGWNKFGVEILEENIPAEELDKEEIRYIAKYNTFEGRGYNCAKGGEGVGSGENHPFYGEEHSRATKEKISNAVSGKKNPMYGKRHSKEARDKISEKCDNSGTNNPMYGKNHSEKTKQKIGKAEKGFKHTKETKGKMSEAQRGTNNPNSKLSLEEGKKIKQEYEEDKDTIQEGLAKKYGIAPITVNRIVNERHWTTRDDKNE